MCNSQSEYSEWRRVLSPTFTHKTEHDLFQDGGVSIKYLTGRFQSTDYRLHVQNIETCTETANGKYFVLITITADDNTDFEAKYEAKYKGIVESGVLTKTRSTSDKLWFSSAIGWFFRRKLSIKIYVRNVLPINYPIDSFVERGSSVTLIGSDGNVLVPKRLLKLWSGVFEAMFSHDSKEKQTGTIELNDFDSKSLEAFRHFLLTREIKDGKDTALQLILLGDKYDIEGMKVAAEEFVKFNVEDMDKEKVLNVFQLVTVDQCRRSVVCFFARTLLQEERNKIKLH